MYSGQVLSKEVKGLQNTRVHVTTVQEIKRRCHARRTFPKATRGSRSLRERRTQAEQQAPTVVADSPEMRERRQDRLPRMHWKARDGEGKKPRHQTKN